MASRADVKLMQSDRAKEIGTNLNQVALRMNAAIEQAGRQQGSVKLLPVTKFHPVSDIRILNLIGLKNVAESREQEAKEKFAELPEANFHMIGQIQTKKANSVARWATMVHSVDSTRLVEALNRGMDNALADGSRTQSLGRVLPCLVQLSIDGDPTRGGVFVTDVWDVISAFENAPNLKFSGLMCVPPLGADPAESFDVAANLLAQLEEQFSRKLEFSAGMSNDMEKAISAGSTIVRVGTGILGPRPVL